ncbi:sensor histidine kinase [Aquabacterium sp.]|uniref:sensor histidine kinase n=1 Tax=Aquabacterium sp. TaxID=1872578 RepID=UPI003D6CB114
MTQPQQPPLPPALPLAIPHTDGELARLRQRLDDHDDLLALVGHELRNPLHSLSLMVSVARLSAQSEQAHDTLDRITKVQANLQRYVHRVTVLLDLLSHEGQAFPAKHQTVELGQALANILEGLMPEGQYRQVAVHFHGPSDPCHAVLDMLVLEQIVDNLMLNAFKHAACTNVTVTMACAQGWAEIAIADDGRGIEKNDQERVFNKYAVAENSGRGTGSGLGLWIVRRLSQVLGGSVSLTSTPGQGCTFTLRIPLNQPAHNATT